jgi:DNA-binding transcriptional MerR regulator
MVYSDPTQILDARHNTPMCRRFREVIPQTAALTDPRQATALFTQLTKRMLREWEDNGLRSSSQKSNTFLLYLCFCSHSLIEDLLEFKHTAQLRMTRNKVREFYSSSAYFHRHFDELRRTECISELFDVNV